MINKEKIMEGVKLILEGIGEDPSREGLIETPDRIARMYEEIFDGIGKTAKEHLSKTFTADSDDLVIEKDITFYSTCEHHLVPFYGKVHIAYVPNGKVVGLSKLARTVEVYAKKPQLQERLTKEIADAVMEYLDAKGVMVYVEAEHMCMTMRGIKKPGTRTITTSYRGVFKEDNVLRQEVLSLIK
ncbi:MAG: GTP cyclohydrolase I FolE [Clostridium sp.]|nr:GTP cyclohydrolase I FolE [Clostridium sp.]